MYLEHYGLNRMPFDISPDPSFLWLGEKHNEAFAYLEYGLVDNRRFLVITGDVGTGKTALIKCFVQMIEDKAVVAVIPDPDMGRMDFYTFLANELQLGGQINSKCDFLIHFKQALLQAHQSDKKVLLIIDEAQRLNHDILHEIRFLANIDVDGRMLLNIFLVGQNELKEILLDPENKSVRDRITASYQINPLAESEVAAYIRHRLQVAGTTNLIFTPNASHAIYRHTRGYPRAINILCDRALLNGFVKEKEVINAAIVEEAAADLKFATGNNRLVEWVIHQIEAYVPPRYLRRLRRIPRLPAIATVGLMVLLGFWVYLTGDYLIENLQRQKERPIAGRIQGTGRQEPPREKRTDTPVGAVKERKASRLVEDRLSGGQGPPGADRLKTSSAISKKTGLAGTSDPEGGAAAGEIVSRGTKKSFVVNFDRSSDEISPQSLKVLNHITEMFYKSPVKYITIKGYGASEDNGEDSMHRSVDSAMRVKKFFISNGIPAVSLKVQVKGARGPAGVKPMGGERQKGRPVEIEVNLSQVPTE